MPAPPYRDGDEDKILQWVAALTRQPSRAAREPRQAARPGVLGEWWRRANVRDVLGAMGTGAHDAEAQCSGCAALTGFATDPSRCATLQGAATRTGAASAVVRALAHHVPTAVVQAAACTCIAVLAMDEALRAALLAAGASDQVADALKKHPNDPEVQQFGLAALAMLLVEDSHATAKAQARGAGRTVEKALGKKHWGAQGQFVGNEDIARFAEWLLAVFGRIAEPKPEPEPEPEPAIGSGGAREAAAATQAEAEVAALIAARREKLQSQEQQRRQQQEQQQLDAAAAYLDGPGPRRTPPESPSKKSRAPISHYLDSLPFNRSRPSSADGVERNLKSKDKVKVDPYPPPAATDHRNLIPISDAFNFSNVYFSRS